MRKDEKFVAESLVNFFKDQGTTSVTYSEPQIDPPDMILNINGVDSSIEITKTDENSINARTGYARGYQSFIEGILDKYKQSIPPDASYIITVHHSSIKVGKIRKRFDNFFRDVILQSNFSEKSYEFSESSVSIKFSKIERSPSRGQFPMLLLNRPNRISKNIEDVAKTMCLPLNDQLWNIVSKCIEKKEKKCRDIKPPVWLALHDSFTSKFSACNAEQFDMYDSVIPELHDKNKFQRILVVLENGSVKEYT